VPLELHPDCPDIIAVIRAIAKRETPVAPDRYRVEDSRQNRLPVLLRIGLCLFALVAIDSVRTGDAFSPIETIAARTAQTRTGNQASFQRFAVTRDYGLFADEKQTPKSHAVTETEFTLPDLKSNTIRQTSGTGFGKRIVRRMPACEAGVKTMQGRIQAHSWPGSVRDLNNGMEQAVVLETDNWIGMTHLPNGVLSGQVGVVKGIRSFE